MRVTPTFGMCVAAAVLVVAAPGVAGADDANEPLVKGVQDNSFLIEEAYNQEPGVVQHIMSFSRIGGERVLTFTQEWPLRSQTHQFSYSVPYIWLRSDGEHKQGPGDLLLNYRLQALTETSVLPAFAPRFSLIVPSGDRGKDTGNNSLGYEINLPFSKVVGDRVAVHANAGLNSFADVDGLKPTSYKVGGSVVIALTRRTNILFEAVREWNEAVLPGRIIEKEKVLTVLPGLRHAINLDDAQLVMGIGAPVSFSQGQRDYGALLYLSYEHKFLK